MLGIFLDTETNGLNPFKHQVTEIAFKILDVETGNVIESYESVVSQDAATWANSDPESLQINGFTLEIVSQGKEKKVVAQEIQDLFAKVNIKRGSSVFICQNPSFDRPFFAHFIDADLQEKKLWPYHWLDLASMHWASSLLKKKKDSSELYPWITGLSKDKIAETFHLQTEEKPHRAMNGVNHLILCYEAVVGFPVKKNS